MEEDFQCGVARLWRCYSLRRTHFARMFMASPQIILFIKDNGKNEERMGEWLLNGPEERCPLKKMQGWSGRSNNST
jgi:hypothetical protein